MSEAHEGLSEAMAAFHAEADKLRLGKDRTGQVGNQKTKYLSLDKLTDETRPALLRHGLVWQTFPSALDGKPALRYRLTHVATGDFLEDTMLLMLEKSNSQGQASALTYSRRYARLAVLDLVADDDDDGAAASDTRLMVSRLLDSEEAGRMETQIREAGLEVAEVLDTVGATDITQVSLAQAQQVKGILKLRGKRGGS